VRTPSARSARQTDAAAAHARVGRPAKSHVAEHHGEAEDEQRARHLCRRVAGDIAQPGRHPERGERDRRRLARADAQRHAPECAIARDGGKTAQLRHHALAALRRAALGHRQVQQQAHRQIERDDAGEHFAPVENAQQHLQRHGSDHGAEHATRESDPVHAGDALRRVPQGEGRKRRHQAARDAQADQAARRGELRGARAEREPDAAGRGDQEHRGIDAPRPVAIEQHAERQLEHGKGEEEDRRQQPQPGGREPELARDLGPDDGVHRAVDVGHEIPRQKRQGNAQENYFFSSPPR
jgi:hypothetical protein